MSDLEQALEHHRAGRLAQAEAAYRQVLMHWPDEPEALHLLGVLYLQSDRLDLAVEYIARAVQHRPDMPDYRYDLGIALTRQGKLSEAGQQFRTAIELKPDFAEAHNNLGNTLREQGKAKEAIQCYRRALELCPTSAVAHNNLGALLQEQGQHHKAIAHYRRALEVDPADADTYMNLGNALHATGRLEEAISAYRRVIDLRRDCKDAYLNLGRTLKELGRLDQAIESYQDGLRLFPQAADLHNNLATSLAQAGRTAEACGHYEKALQLNPTYAEAYYNLGNTLGEIGDYDKAIAVYRRALSINPNLAEAHYNLGIALQRENRFAEAVETCRRALTLNPNDPKTENSLGHALLMQGRFDEALDWFQRALNSKPDFRDAHQNLLATLNYRPGVTPQMILEEAQRWDQRHASPFRPSVPVHMNERSTGRQLRLGYVSPDFRRHSVAFFLEPILAHRNRERFEVFCYADVRHGDATTARLRNLADHWRDIDSMSDGAVAALIREDQIDILVDLAGHTEHNRLLVFARKPAPIQVTYLGYPNTTGLVTMDYRFTDALADPPGQTERWHSETLVRLPHGFLCYQPPADAPAVVPPPESTAHLITFGSFNSAAKIGDAVIACWAGILQGSPGARLLLKAPQLVDPATRERLAGGFAAHGITVDRLEMIPRVTDQEHLQMYGRVDIALDTFPYNGTTITCEALWMGVPVITLAGQTHAGRVGVSLLTQMGLTELIAESVDDYVARAVQLGRDLPRLAELRRTLRVRMQRSPLTDASTFTRGLEDTYRIMWQQWCEKQSPDVNLAAVSQERNVEALAVAIRGGVSVVVPHSLQLLTPYVLVEQEDWFEDEIAFVRRFLQPGMRAIDIGASYGVYTLSMAERVGPEGKVWAFEPARGPAVFLDESIGKNGFKNITVYRMALSNRNGQAKLKVGANTEMSMLGGAEDQQMDCEIVTVRTLDSLLHETGLREIDFAKMDAEGEESRILEAAREFLQCESPLILFELKHGNQLNWQLLGQFQDSGYGIYRLVPGLELLVPFDTETTPDPFQLNLFACKLDRARMLQERGLLVAVTIDNPDARLAAPESWAPFLGRFAYARTLLESWRNTARAERLPRAVASREALDHYVYAHRADVAPAQRYFCLKRAFAILSRVVESEGNLCRWQSLARVAWELGERATAVESLSRFLARFQTEGRVVLEEPFLAVSRRFESLDPAAKIAEWCIASVLEQRERLRSFSSYFVDPTALETLTALERLGFYAPEMERRRQLIRLRHRMQSYPEPHPLLAAETGDNRNSAFWLGRR